MRFLLLALLCPSLLIQAQTTPSPAASTLTTEQMASIMKQLDQLESQITQNRNESLGTALSRFRNAMGSGKDSLALYLDCVKLVEFDRKNLKQADFQQWKDRNDARVKDPNFILGLQLQLEYLVISLQAQDAEDLGPYIPALQNYITKAITTVQSTMKHTASGAVEEKNRNPGTKQGVILAMLRQSVKATDFSKAYKLDEYLKREGWVYEPLSIDAIYTSIIFPYYLKEKPAELPAQWDARINAELALRKFTQSEAEYQEYSRDGYPVLLWTKAKYLLDQKINPIMALADMLKIVRENPTHPRAAGWLKELRASVSQSEPELPSPGLTDPAAPEAS